MADSVAKEKKRIFNTILKCDDILSLFPSFGSYALQEPKIVNATNTSRIVTKFYKANELPENLFQHAFDLSKKNMEKLYNNAKFNGGWKDKEKKRELKHGDSRYIYAFDAGLLVI